MQRKALHSFQFVYWKEQNIEIYFMQRSLIVFDVILILLQKWSKLKPSLSTNV